MKNSTKLLTFPQARTPYSSMTVGIMVLEDVFIALNWPRYPAFRTTDLSVGILKSHQKWRQIELAKTDFQNLTLYFNNSVTVRVFFTLTFVI